MYLLPKKYYLQKLKNYLWHLPKSLLANLVYGFPSQKLVLIAVTGTDGKTSTCTLIHQCLVNAGFQASIISTINSPGLHTTTPDSFVLQKMLRHMVNGGITHCVIETTAHGIDQFRFFGCKFKVGVITNITQDHFDDFFNYQNYAQTKTKLFYNCQHQVFNSDDNYYKVLQNKFPNHLSYSIQHPSHIQATNIVTTAQGLSFKVGDNNFTTNTIYQYMIYNILATLGVTRILGIDDKILQKTIKKIPETTGRRQIVENDLGINTIIDFAHTPNALEQTLKSLKNNTKGKLICIFGATGGRDKTKRPLMGQAVAKYADIAIVTSDDTRNEKIEEINKSIISGFPTNGSFIFFDIPNRQDAFNQAIKIAKKGDVVIACGKGHETSILLGSTEYPWSEAEAFRTAFRQASI